MGLGSREGWVGIVLHGLSADSGNGGGVGADPQGMCGWYIFCPDWLIPYVMGVLSSSEEVMFSGRGHGWLP